MPNPVEVFIDSAYGESGKHVKPLIGKVLHPYDTEITIELTKREFDVGNQRFTYIGYTGTGDAPPKGESPTVTFQPKQNSSVTFNWKQGKRPLLPEIRQAISISALLTILCIALVGYYYWQRPFVVAVFGGALGGLFHEIIQSGGKYILPDLDESGNFVLGGLIGIITGGVAGLLLYEGLLGPGSVVLDAKLAVGAIVAGLAVKGIADAPNPS
jgi:hypothetical protein